MESKVAQKKSIIRPPVVVILGHIDHGKSSLLESIKDLKITSKESGGITQHIGAYEIDHKGKKITFIDTPGHEAFCAIRSRGAKVADIAILVVAAEEGIKPQTIEALECAKQAELPIIVAINKIDKAGANPQKIKNELLKYGIIVEQLGGKVPVVETSATKKIGIEELIEIILLSCEVEGLSQENEDNFSSGVIIESFLDSKRGPSATLIIKSGTLGINDIIATKSTMGRVRILENFLGSRIEKGTISQPIMVIGFENIPKVGEEFRTFLSIESAKEYMIEIKEQKERSGSSIPKDKKSLNLVIKADVIGSTEAIEVSLGVIPSAEVAIRILESGAGEVNEDDVKLALAANGQIISFRTKTNIQARKLAEQKGVKILSFEIIYDLIEKVRELMREIIESETVKKNVGRLRVLVIFKTEGRRQIVGGRIVEGELRQGLKVEVFREEKKIGAGKIIGLQKNKKEIEKGVSGEEVGILYEGNAVIKEGDMLIGYIEEKKKAGF